MSYGNAAASALTRKLLSKGHRAEQSTNSERQFLTIGPALPACNTVRNSAKNHSRNSTKNTANKKDAVILQSLADGTIHLSRSPQEKERNPDRLNLDRRGLAVLPKITGEAKLRLLSLQHNLINTLDGFSRQDFPLLVFLDVYDNQLEKIHSLDKLKNLRVLLLGKNRIRKIEGLNSLCKIEILDLHGNQIQHVTGLSVLSSLRVLNLAGNQIEIVGVDDLRGLHSLQELNLKRNKLRKLYGFDKATNLQKLYLSNNDIQSIDDMRSVAKLKNLKDVTIDNNPISSTTDCVSFLISYLPQLAVFNSSAISESTKKTAMAWRRNKENSDPTFVDLSSDVLSSEKREEVISNAKINWELISSHTKGLTTKTSVNNTTYKCVNPQPDHDFFVTTFSKKQKERKSPMMKESRAFSFDAENSQNTSSSSSSVNDFFRLPPILVPIVNRMDQVNVTRKESGSLSSVDPNVSSTPRSLCDTNSSGDSSSSENFSAFDESDNETSTDDLPKEANEINTNESCRKSPSIEQNSAAPPKNVDSGSDISANTSSSGINISCVTIEEDLSCHSKSTRNVKSATPFRSSSTKINTRAATAKPKKLPPSLPANPPGKVREQGGDYLIEINDRHLNIYGQGALRYIDKQWNATKAGEVHTVNFNYANFSGITSILNKIKQKFPNAENFIFKETNIYCLGQINAFAEIQGLSSLHIEKEGNPITEKRWEDYAIYRLSHWGLRILNGKEISDVDVNRANVEYQSLSNLVLYLLPDTLLQPLLMRLHLENNYGTVQNCKKWLMLADVALKNVVTKEALQWKKTGVGQEEIMFRQRAKEKLAQLLDDMCDAVNKVRLLDKQWPVILQEIVCNTLLDFSQIDIYMKKKIQELR